MWSGGQSGWGPGHGPGPPPIRAWSLDPNHYSQIPHQQVDWASLAQQWIQMKGTDVLPPIQPQQHVSPMPLQSSLLNSDPHHQDVIGEAPMDLDESAGQSDHGSSAPLYTRSSSRIPSSQITSSGTTVQKVIMPHIPSPSTPQSSLQPWIRPSFQQNHIDQQSQSSSPAVYGESNFAPDSNADFGLSNTDPHPSKWSQNQSVLDVNSFNDRGKQYHYSKSTQRKQSYQDDEAYEEYLDAAKRKALPSWIREGLEKVEREKKKAEEKERQVIAREEERRRRRMRDHQGDMGLKTEDQTPHSQPIIGRASISDEPLTIKLTGFLKKPQSPPLTLKEILSSLSREEQMEQVMLSVRRQLTHILLEVTNDEMGVVAREALERAKAKQKGLGDYGSDSEEDLDESPEHTGNEEDKEEDSDDELMAEIERKKRNYDMKFLSDEEEEADERSTTTNIQTLNSRSRLKSTESKGSNGRIPDTPSLLPPKITSDLEKGRGEEKVDEKKSEQNLKRRSRSGSVDKGRRRRSSRSQSSSRKEIKKEGMGRSESRSEERKNRRSRSKKRDRRHRSRSSSNPKRRKSRSQSKSKKERKNSKDSRQLGSTTRRRRSQSKTRSRTRSKDRKRKSEKSRRHRSISSSSTQSSSRSNSSRRQSQSRPQRR